MLTLFIKRRIYFVKIKFYKIVFIIKYSFHYLKVNKGYAWRIFWVNRLLINFVGMMTIVFGILTIQIGIMYFPIKRRFQIFVV